MTCIAREIGRVGAARRRTWATTSSRTKEISFFVATGHSQVVARRPPGLVLDQEGPEDGHRQLLFPLSIGR